MVSGDRVADQGQFQVEGIEHGQVRRRLLRCRDHRQVAVAVEAPDLLQAIVDAGLFQAQRP